MVNSPLWQQTKDRSIWKRNNTRNHLGFVSAAKLQDRLHFENLNLSKIVFNCAESPAKSYESCMLSGAYLPFNG